MKCSNSKCNLKATHIRVDMFDGVIQSYINDRPYCTHHIARFNTHYLTETWYRETITLEEWQLRQVKSKL